MIRGIKLFFNWAIVFLGFVQMAGWIFNCDQLETLGLLTGASPLPLVFNQIDGLEYWASKIQIQIKMVDGTSQNFRITPELFSRLKGPHVLHLSYALPVALAPISPPTYWHPPVFYGFCNPGKLIHLLKVSGTIHSVNLTILNQAYGKETKWDQTINCLPPV